MPKAPRSISSRQRLAILVCACLGLAACGTAEPLASETTLKGWSDTVAPPVADTEPAPPTSLPFASETTETTAVETVETVELTGELPRTTPAGIRITSSFEQVDFNDGNGNVDTIYYDASDRVGVYLEPTFADTPANETDSEVWAASGGVLLLVLHAGPGVTEMTVESTNGSVDRAAPGADGVIVLAVPGSKIEEIEAKAFDSSGTLLATCGPDPEFGWFDCW